MSYWQKQKHSGKLNIGNLEKHIYYTNIQIIIGGLNIDNFIKKLPIHLYDLLHVCGVVALQL